MIPSILHKKHPSGCFCFGKESLQSHAISLTHDCIVRVRHTVAVQGLSLPFFFSYVKIRIHIARRERGACMPCRLRLSGNVLKLIAAFSMLLDHFSLIFFPQVIFLRILGRLAFPIFAFMIAEGCLHTKNKVKYFFSIFALAVLCQVVYFVFDRSLYMSVLVTFSLGILMCFALQNAKNICFSQALLAVKLCSVLLFVISVAFAYCLNRILTIDYGFWGCMLPVFASLLQAPRENAPSLWRRLDKPIYRVLTMGLGLLILSWDCGGIQFYSLITLVLLLQYSGERGKRKLKYFFYIFYPAHLALLEGIYILLHLQ